MKQGNRETGKQRGVKAPLLSVMKYDMVKVKWLDSLQPVSSWQFLSDYKPSEPILCVSVGFLIHNGDDVKAIAPNMGDDNQISGVIHIPAISILSITKLIEKE